MSNSIIAEYVYLTKIKSSSKSKNATIQSLSVWPKWTYDGSSTGQALVMIRRLR